MSLSNTLPAPPPECQLAATKLHGGLGGCPAEVNENNSHPERILQTVLLLGAKGLAEPIEIACRRPAVRAVASSVPARPGSRAPRFLTRGATGFLDRSDGRLREHPETDLLLEPRQASYLRNLRWPHGLLLPSERHLTSATHVLPPKRNPSGGWPRVWFKRFMRSPGPAGRISHRGLHQPMAATRAIPSPFRGRYYLHC